MKATGVVRRVDGLGRIVIPKEIRRVNGIQYGDPMEILIDGDNIVLHRYEPGCIFCDRTDEIITFKGKKICQKCLTAMAAIGAKPEVV